MYLSLTYVFIFYPGFWICYTRSPTFYFLCFGETAASVLNFLHYLPSPTNVWQKWSFCSIEFHRLSTPESAASVAGTVNIIHGSASPFCQNIKSKSFSSSPSDFKSASLPAVRQHYKTTYVIEKLLRLLDYTYSNGVMAVCFYATRLSTALCGLPGKIQGT